MMCFYERCYKIIKSKHPRENGDLIFAGRSPIKSGMFGAGQGALTILDYNRFLFFLCILFVLPSNLHAKDQSDVRTICDHVKQTQKNNSVDYVPGVDVHGNNVVSADMNPNAGSFLNNPVVIPVQIDLVERFGLDVPTAITLEPTITQIKIYPDGRIKYNDDDVSAHISESCQKLQGKQDVNLEQEDRQKPPDPVGSKDKIEGQYPE